MICCVAMVAVNSANGDEPLHVRIDALIATKANGAVAGPADDAEIVRRMYLDLAGRIPTVDELRKFLADKSPEKRQQLVDQLLASPDYARRMEQFFTVMLLERRVGKEITDERWEAYLRESFAANKSWDQLVREIIAADSTDAKVIPAMKFFVDRIPGGVELQVRDVGRLFLGKDLQCARCHDHPLVKEYEQVHFHGLAAFLNRSFMAKDPQTKEPLLAEKPEATKVSFESVFIRGQKETGPRLLSGTEIAIPTFEKGQELAEPAANGKPAVPKFRTRQLLAVELTKPENKAFTANIVNRLWYLMMGRGLVHPLDLHHSDNPPSHPELLRLLADEFVAMKFDVKKFLRELALTSTYLRSSVLPEGVTEAPAPESYRVANSKGLSAEQMVWSYLTATSELAGVEAATAAPKLDDYYKKFRGVFSSPPGEPEVEFAPSLAAALFLANDQLVLNCVKPHAGNLVDRLSKLTDAKAIADELYASVLSRLPSAEEQTDVSAYLERRGGQRVEALGELVWSLVSSTEFCVNH